MGGRIAFAISVAFSIVVFGQQTWSAYDKHSLSASLGGLSEFKRAVSYFNHGARQAAQQPREAEAAYRRALPLWEKLADTPRSRPAKRK